MKPAISLSRQEGVVVLPVLVAVLLSSVVAFGPHTEPVAAAPRVSAHAAADYFNSTWNISTVNMWFVSTFPTDAVLPFRQRVREGFENWPVSGSQRPAIAVHNGTSVWTTNACLAQKSGVVPGVHWDSIGGSLGAVTNGCTFGNTMVNAQVRFDSDGSTSWHTLDSVTPSTHVDLEGFAAHEFGHVLGGWRSENSLGHFDPSFADCSQPDTETMCAQTQPGLASYRWRTPRFVHDQHTMANAY